MSEPGADAMDDGAAGRPPGDMLSVGMLYSASSIPLPTTYDIDPDSSVRAATHMVAQRGHDVHAHHSCGNGNAASTNTTSSMHSQHAQERTADTR